MDKSDKMQQIATILGPAVMYKEISSLIIFYDYVVKEPSPIPEEVFIGFLTIPN